MSEGLALIPTKWHTEVYCWEFKGKVEDNEFLVYINAQTGKEEDILLIVNTPDGTLTHWSFFPPSPECSCILNKKLRKIVM